MGKDGLGLVAELVVAMARWDRTQEDPDLAELIHWNFYEVTSPVAGGRRAGGPSAVAALLAVRRVTVTDADDDDDDPDGAA